MTCPNITYVGNSSDEEFDAFFDDTELNEPGFDLNDVISDSILLTLNELLPRTEAQLYTSDITLPETNPNGIVKINRTRTFNNNTNTTRIEESYTENDFVEWKPDVIPRKFDRRHSAEIDSQTHHIISTSGTHEIEIEIFDQMFYENIDYTLSLTQVDMLSSDVIVMMEQVFDYEYSNAYESDSTSYYTKTFTLNDWYNAFFESKGSKKKSEFDWHYYDNNGDEFFPDENPFGAYFDLSPNDVDSRRRNLLIDSKITIFEQQKKLAEGNLLGIPVSVTYASEISLKIPFVKKTDAGTPDINGCSGPGGLASATSDYETEIEACCNVHDWDYANCDMTKKEADNRLINCVEQYDSTVATIMQDAFDLPKISDTYYLKSKWDNCMIDPYPNPFNADVEVNFNVGGNSIFRLHYGYDNDNRPTTDDELITYDIFKIHLGGGCVFIYVGMLCFELWLSVDLNVEIPFGKDFIGLNLYVAGGVTADAYAELLGIARVGLLLRGDLAHVGAWARLNLTSDGNIDGNPADPKNSNVTQNIVLSTRYYWKTLVVTARTYYRYRYIDAGCKCNCAWVCCPSCWFNIRWSGYKTWTKNTWVLGVEDGVTNSWTLFARNGDTIWGLWMYEIVEIDVNIARNNETTESPHSRLLLYDENGLDNVVKPTTDEIRKVLKLSQFDTLDVNVKLSYDDMDANKLVMRTNILFNNEYTANFANSVIKTQAYRDDIASLLSEKSNEPLKVNLESSGIEETILQPTPRPTTAPTNEPTAAPTWVSPCMNNPCVCEDNPILGYVNEDPYCQVCNMPSGCAQCQNGGEYFKLDYNHPCTQCQQVFGDECLHCQDFNGCAQCANGFERVYDSQEDLFYCTIKSDHQDTGDDGQNGDEEEGDGENEFDCSIGLELCNSQNCAGEGDNNPHCATDPDTWGCYNCQYGYWHETNQHKCQECSIIPHCLQCENYNGCTQCDSVYTLVWSHDCDFWICV